MAVVAGWDDTRAALARWNRDVPGVLRAWFGTSLAIGLTLLAATWAVGTWFAPHHVEQRAVFSTGTDLWRAAGVFERNLLVLAMHALICVAGYMGSTSAGIAAEDYTGFTRRVHLLARPVTFAFVACVTASSFTLQAWTLGSAVPGVAAAYGVGIGHMLLLLAPHAVPELVAVFLPLGAWLVIARRSAWPELLAASMAATALAVPILVFAALVEEYVAPIIVASATH
ncbi:MAG: hypothetical protein JWM98_2123 [Thermoleophilia bacterium]|nr:hypothetical protein [Thermoleophilia bacterium]